MNIKNLLSGRWEKIATQGGDFGEFISFGTYHLTGLWIAVNSKWIEISALECSENNFCLSVFILDEPPVPDLCKINNPPRVVVEKFPKDCPLKILINNKKNEYYSVLLNEDPLRKNCFLSIEIKINDGQIFRIHPSDIVLGDLEVNYSKP